jgi:predicted SAM-dependent methyltransferase
MRRLEVARQLSRWFPIAVSDALKGAFDAKSKAVCWEVPSSVRGKYEFLSRFTFNLCFENSISPGYLTEKLFDSVYSGCVPLYEGDPGFAEWFDDSGVINCSGLDAEEIADRIRQAERDGLQDRIDNERDGLLRVGFAEMMHRIESFAAEIGGWAGASDTRFHHNGHSHTPPPRDVVALKRGAHSPFANLTVVIKAFLRPEILAQNIAGIRETLGESCPIIVVDDSRVPLLDAVPKGVRHVSMPFDSGASAGRNFGVALANTKFVFIVDDDCLLRSSAREVEQCLSLLEQGWDVVGGGVCDLVPDGDVLVIRERIATRDVQRCDITYNFFVARREILLEVPWDEDMKVSPEHAEHFLRLRAKGAKVGGTSLLRYTNVGGGSDEYRRFRGRRYFQKLSRRWGYSSCHWQYLPRDNHFEAPAVPTRIKICIGQQPATQGWLNVGEPIGLGMKRTCDLRKPLPFAEASVELAWIDRGLEKLDQATGTLLLSEVYRVLAPGGILRLATFDLGFLIRLGSGQLGEIGERYIKWTIDSFIPAAPGYDASFVLNHQMRAWGHKYLHDETTLADALESAGFEETVRLLVGQSSHEAFHGIEDPDRLPEGFALLETLVLEVRKPPMSSD